MKARARRPASLALLLALLLAGCEPEGPGPFELGDWRDRAIYQVVIDRFADGDPSNNAIDGVGAVPGDLARFQGGDLRGLIEGLDYLERLGVSGLWISPVYRNVGREPGEDGYHGYWAADYLEMNPRFGRLEDLQELVREAHARDMAVILDVVPNHAGRVFDYDLDGDGESDPEEAEPPYLAEGYEAPLLWRARPRLLRLGPGGEREPFELEAEHFNRRGRGELNIEEQRRFGDFPTGLRDLDTSHPEVIEGLIETHLFWIEESGVDGFRIDAVPHTEREFWQAFCGGLRARLAERGVEGFLFLGEVFETDPERLAGHIEPGGIDAAFALDFKFGLIDDVVLDGRSPRSALGPLGENRAFFLDSPQEGGIGLSPWEGRFVLADSHDLWRVRGELDDPRAAELAMTAVLTADGVPVIYYGTEQELAGQGHHESREPLWPTGYREDTFMFLHLRRLLELRRRSRALRRGGVTVRYAAERGAREGGAEDAGLLAWERALEGAGDRERILVALSTDAFEERSARVPTGFSPGATLRDLLSGDDRRWPVEEDGAVDLRLAPRSALLLGL